MTDPRTHDGGAPAALALPPTPDARERVVAQLSSCFSDDRLPLAEFERRVHTAYATPSSAELQQLLADLIPPDQIDGAPTMFPARSEIRTVLSSAERGGAMFVPRRLEVKTVLGSTELDLTLAVFAPGVTEIVVKAVLGSVEIALPANVQVSSEGSPFLGSFTLKSGAAHVGEPPRSIVRITGKAVLGSVDTWVAAPRVPTPLDASHMRIGDR